MCPSCDRYCVCVALHNKEGQHVTCRLGLLRVGAVSPRPRVERASRVPGHPVSSKRQPRPAERARAQKKGRAAAECGGGHASPTEAAAPPLCTGRLAAKRRRHGPHEALGACCQRRRLGVRTSRRRAGRDARAEAAEHSGTGAALHSACLGLPCDSPPHRLYIETDCTELVLLREPRAALIPDVCVRSSQVRGDGRSGLPGPTPPALTAYLRSGAWLHSHCILHQKPRRPAHKAVRRDRRL